MTNDLTLKAFPPNDALKAFEPIIGVWKTVGEHSLIPNTTLHGRTSFSWHESGAFIVVKTHINEDVGIPDGLSMIGADDKLGTYIMIYYDERGVSRHYQLSINANVIKWWRDDPTFSQRYTLIISDDKRTIDGRGEMSNDGSTWEQDLDLTYSKE